MCGISGIYAQTKVDRLDMRIDKMNEAIIHRRSESEVFYTFEQKVALDYRLERNYQSADEI